MLVGFLVLGELVPLLLQPKRLLLVLRVQPVELESQWCRAEEEGKAEV